MQTTVNAARASRRADVVAALCDLLSRGDEADRCYACHALGALGAAEATPALAERLRDEDIDVCVDAALALGALGSQAAIAPLEESLYKDPDGEVKIAVVESLATFAAPQTIPLLMQIAERRPTEMIFDESTEWDPWWDMQRAAVLALGRARVSEAAPMLARLLDEEDRQDIDAEIMAVLAELGDAGERTLLERLRHRSEQVRRRAATALGRGSSPAGIEALSRALDDDSPHVRSAALEALEKRRGRHALPAILRLYRDPDAGVRRAAIRVGTRLGAAGGGDAPDLQALLALLGDKDPKVRASALAGMDRERIDEALVEHFCEALKDPEPEVAAIACGLLSRHGTDEHCQSIVRIAEDAASDPELRRSALRALGKRGAWNETIASLMATTLSEAKSPVRLAAMNALLDLHRAGAAARESSSAGVPAARESEQTPSPLDLVIAALAGDMITRADTEESPGSASETTQDAPAARDYEIAVEVVAPGDEIRPAKSSLEAIAIDNAEVALALAESENEDVATQIEPDEEMAEYLALTEANEATARWMFTRDALEADLDVRRLAARILGSAASESAVAALTQALASEDAALRREAAASLAAIADRFPRNRALAAGIDALIDGADAEDRDLRIACLHALARLEDVRAHARVAAALNDQEPTVRIEALRGLGTIEQDAAAALANNTRAAFESYFPRVAERLSDPEPGVRIAAARVLAAMLSGCDRDSRAVSEVIDSLIRAAFAGTGDQAREMGRALRTIAPVRATDRLLEELRSLASSAERRVTIELLEEVHCDRDQSSIETVQKGNSSTSHAGELAT